MGQVTSGQRIKTATKDHARVSMVHLKLHGVGLACAIALLCVLGMAAFVVVGITQPNVESEWKVTGLKKGPGCS